MNDGVNSLEKVSFLMMKISKIALKIAVYIVVVSLIGGVVFNYGFKLFYEDAIDSNDKNPIVFTINLGDDVDTIAENLYNARLIEDKFVFKFRSMFYDTNFFANTYELNKSMTIKDMLDIFDNANSANVVESTKETEEEVYQLASENE